VTGCEACKQLLDGFVAVSATIEKARAAEPGPFVITRIRQHIESELTKPEIKPSYALRPILLTLTMLCAIAAGIAIGKVNSDRISGYDEYQSQIEDLKTDLFIHDFIDENKTLVINE
jgi:hypothetical protein